MLVVFHFSPSQFFLFMSLKKCLIFSHRKKYPFFFFFFCKILINIQCSRRVSVCVCVIYDVTFLSKKKIFSLFTLLYWLLLKYIARSHDIDFSGFLSHPLNIFIYIYRFNLCTYILQLYSIHPHCVSFSLHFWLLRYASITTIVSFSLLYQ